MLLAVSQFVIHVPIVRDKLQQESINADLFLKWMPAFPNRVPSERGHYYVMCSLDKDGTFCDTAFHKTMFSPLLH
jgi:hypothetical protein